MNRWRVVVGGVSMNLALGSLYAWSVFVLPLEKEFGWTRSQTSWVYTIAVVVFASTFMLGGYGAGSAIIGPIATNLITSAGWRPTFRLLAAAFLAMGLVGAWLLENPPQGYRPSGWIPPPATATRGEYSTREMLRTPQFY